jgi:hypothetical protein
MRKTFRTRHVPARDLKVGDRVMIVDPLNSSLLLVRTIMDLYLTTEWGVFNPMVMGGDLVVNGVVVSPYAIFLFENWFGLKTSSLPAIYEVILMPICMALTVFGKDAIGVLQPMFRTNDEPTPENWYYIGNVLSIYWWIYEWFVCPVSKMLTGAQQTYTATKSVAKTFAWIGVCALFLSSFWDVCQL